MSVVEFVYSWYNPQRPKCRNCKYWIGLRENYYNRCKLKDFKEKAHNQKACVLFEVNND